MGVVFGALHNFLPGHGSTGLQKGVLSAARKLWYFTFSTHGHGSARNPEEPAAVALSEDEPG
jgi:hypothetical protein